MADKRIIRFLSWNLNMMNTSQEAPSGWRVDQTEALIRQRILEENIDVVCFQELPAMVPYVETHELAPANTISHSGTIATICLLYTSPSPRDKRQSRMPSSA